MNRFLILAVVAMMPALLSQAFAQPATGTSAIASDSSKQRNTPTAKTGTLLNTDVAPAQAKQKTEETNHRIAQGKLPGKSAAR
jgi:hypothetical protein